MSREICMHCRKAAVMCYCSKVQRFASTPQFVILLHPRESRKAINTGRMAYRHLENAELWVDADFSEHRALNQLLADPQKSCYLLFPGDQAIDLDTDAGRLLIQDGRQPVFIILDATWKMAKKMFQLSRNLQAIPQVMFRPTAPSQFTIRQQPHELCYSTIETIHHIIELMGTHPRGEHHHLMSVFKDMVQKQIDYELNY